jgi:hypothetical protein
MPWRQSQHQFEANDMLREISEEVRVNLKDRLRDARHIVRQHRHDSRAATPADGPRARERTPFPLREIEGLLGHAASAFDDAMGMAQTLVPRASSGNGRTARGFATYFPPPRSLDILSGERAFRRDMYELARTMLARRNLPGVLVHEADFVAVHAAMRRRHEPLLATLGGAGGWTDRISVAAQLGAALLVEFLAHKPLNSAPARLSPTSPGEVSRNDAIACLAPMALACSLASVDPDGDAEPDLIDMALLAVDARMERVRQACNGPNPQDDLTALFALLLAHLP